MGESLMKVLVTGARGFIGKNLITELERIDNIEIFPLDIDTPIELLDDYCRECDFVFNLAGVNRPENEEEFMEGNFGFATKLVETLKKYGNACPVMNASSIQAELENAYGKSKKAGEDMLFAYGKETGAAIYIYRFPNIFGKWCCPNYNSVIATFCYNIANDLPIQVNDKNTVLHLTYIDEVVQELLQAMNGNPHMTENGYCHVPLQFKVSLGEIVALLHKFKESRNNLMIPDMESSGFEKRLYSTYLSYLPLKNFSYPLTMHTDDRGSFTEILKSVDRGQVSVNISKPGIMKGNHWHHTKNEKFITVSGEGVIRLRKHGETEIVEFYVNGKELTVVDIPCGYTHSIINTGNTELVTLMWCNECFDSDKPDTIYEMVELEE